MKTNNYLPDGFEKLKTEKPYINLSKLPEGEHRFRIVQRPIGGWIDWKDKKPYRFKPECKPKAPYDAAKPIKPFWAVHVWDYSKEALFVMEITQNSIRQALETLALDEEWGDLTTFDFKIKKEGSGIDTEYNVIAVPHKPMSREILAAIAMTKIRLEALYEGKDPWKDLEETCEFNSDTGELTSPEISVEEADELDRLSLETENSHIEKIKNMFKISSIRDVPKKEFDRTVRYLKQSIINREATHGSAAMA